jgi:hypothetical protein
LGDAGRLIAGTWRLSENTIMVAWSGRRRCN